MPRYIDADLLMKELGITDPDCEKCEWGCKGFPSCTRGSDFVDACDAICEAPTADVVERKNGKWIKHKDRECWYCSHCNTDDYYAYYWSDTGGFELQDRFCPNCGAEMKGADDGDGTEAG